MTSLSKLTFTSRGLNLKFLESSKLLVTLISYLSPKIVHNLADKLSIKLIILSSLILTKLPNDISIIPSLNEYVSVFNIILKY